VEVSLFIAFIAGLLSFLAPCVVPLLPVYLSYITGVSVTELTNKATFSRYRWQVVLNSIFYLAGFSLVFILMGLGAAAISNILLLNRAFLVQIGGVLIILFGLYNLGIFNKYLFFQKEYRFFLPQRIIHTTFVGPFLLGGTFALAWTPCVGGVFASILTLAASSQSMGQGALLLFMYSLGISFPFFIIAVTIGYSYPFLTRLGPKLHYLNILAGIFLIILGSIMAFGKYDVFNGYILVKFSRFLPTSSL